MHYLNSNYQNNPSSRGLSAGSSAVFEKGLDTAVKPRYDDYGDSSKNGMYPRTCNFKFIPDSTGVKHRMTIPELSVRAEYDRLHVTHNGIVFLIREKLNCMMISKSNVSTCTFKSWLLQFRTHYRRLRFGFYIRPHAILITIGVAKMKTPAAGK